MRGLTAVAAVGLLVALIAARGSIQHSDAVSGAVVVFVSISVEALPFVLLGAIVSGTLAVFVPDRVFAAIGRLPLGAQLPIAAFGGIAFPVCECGSVPVARRLTLRGLHPSAALAFMLAAPIVNPVTIASTIIAFHGNHAMAMTVGRVGIGFATAILTGALLGRRGAAMVTPDRTAETAPCDLPGHAGHDHSGHGHAAGGRGRLGAVVDHTTTDLLFMGRFVVAGAALAAAVQTLIPTSVLTGLGGNWLMAPLVMMALAFLLSLCSSADAFVGASFSQFGGGSQLAFLTFGPVLDLKLAMLYGATFGRGFVVRVTLCTVPIVLAGSLLMQALVF